MTFNLFTKCCFPLCVDNLIKKWSKGKKEDVTFLRKKTEKNHNSFTTMICVDRKERIFPLKLKLEGKLFE